MLPGHRTFSDDDIFESVADALAVFRRIDDASEIPDDLRPLVFQVCVNMIGNRTVAPGIIDGRTFPGGAL